MKVLATQEQGALVVLHTPINWAGGAGFEGTDGKPYAEGVVREVPDAAVRRVFEVALRRKEPENFAEKRDYTREMRYFAGALADVVEGTKVKLITTARGYRLDIPEGATPPKAAVAVGDTIAVDGNISPAALINARGVVVGMAGQKVKVNLTAGDLRRVQRKTGKAFKNPVALPKASVEKDDECLVEVSG